MKFCDLQCIYASSAKGEMDGARSCMTFTAIYCRLHERHVMKAQVCPDRMEHGEENTGRGAEVP